MNKLLLITLISIFMNAQDFTQFVNPMIGTGNMGHTFPGATVPFGMVQLSPQTKFVPMFVNGKYNPEVYAYCAGYQYKDSTIIGFTHTNFSGTGHSDLGDILLMPLPEKIEFNEDVNQTFPATFNHNNEKASPGFYIVDFKNRIKAKLTTSERVGFHRYTFPTQQAHILLDMVYNVYPYDNKNVWTFIRVENDSLITGWRQTKGWARTRFQYFAIEFSEPFRHYGHKKYDDMQYNGFYRRFDETTNFPEMAGKNIKAFFDFNLTDTKELMVKVALSNTSTAGAIQNLNAEIPHWDFDRIKLQAKEKWNAELRKIEVETFQPEDKTTFYTALYHSFLSPIIYEDVDGKYRGLDQNMHDSEGFVNYSIFSLWDTYRALHPLFNLIQPKRNNDMIKSMLAHQEQSVHGMLPIWSHYANENWCMIGYHATSVIADAMVKKVGDFDKTQLLQASVATANVPYVDGLEFYLKLGYFPEDFTHSSVSKTLEINYDDWCIAQMAKELKQTEVYAQYLQRSENFKNVFDAESGFMRPKLSNGEFKKEFDPMDTHGQGFIEGNAFNYGLYVPHDLNQMIEMMGGKDKFSAHLDSIFTTEIEEKYIEKNEDITRDGIIGNYVHGNEPGHHIPYLYNWTNDAWKTQARVRMICDTMYGATVEGLCGNDDAGQMSAWYIFSALGFYPVLPGSADYAIGSPNINSAEIHFDNGKTLEIQTKNQSKENVYIQKVIFNSEEIKDLKLNHLELMKGGKLIFEMGNKPKFN